MRRPSDASWIMLMPCPTLRMGAQLVGKPSLKSNAANGLSLSANLWQLARLVNEVHSCANGFQSPKNLHIGRMKQFNELLRAVVIEVGTKKPVYHAAHLAH